MPARLTQSPLEVLLEAEVTSRVTQSPLEVLLAADVTSRVTQSPLEVLLDDSDRNARVSQVVLEVLHTWIPAPPVINCTAVSSLYDPGLQIRYYIEVRGQDGTLKAIFTEFESFEISHELNGIGTYTITLTGLTPADIAKFELDSQIYFYRAVLGIVDWYVEFRGLNRKIVERITENGSRVFTSTGFSYNELLSRKVVAYKAGTIRSDKSAAAETCMKEYVLENCGPTLDYTVVGRLYAGGFPNFTVEADSGAGGLWTGSKAGEVVFDVIQEIAVESGIDFSVQQNGHGSFIFRTYVDQFGADRSIIGLDRTTGRNAAGNVPIIFDVDKGTVQTIEFTEDRSSEITVAIILGKGDGSTRKSVTVSDPTAIADSPWNIREACRSSSGYDEDYETYELTSQGKALLEENQSKETFVFTPLQQSYLLYGQDYALGDLVTAVRNGVAYNRKIVGVSISVSDNVENVTVKFSEIPGVGR